jgi:hypothetical protein
VHEENQFLINTVAQENAPVKILHGHSAHLNNLGKLKFDETNDIVFLCLQSHTTQAL